MLSKKKTLLSTPDFLAPLSCLFSIHSSYQLTIFSSLSDPLISNFSPPLPALIPLPRACENDRQTTGPSCLWHPLLLEPSGVKRSFLLCRCIHHHNHRCRLRLLPIIADCACYPLLPLAPPTHHCRLRLLPIIADCPS